MDELKKITAATIGEIREGERQHKLEERI